VRVHGRVPKSSRVCGIAVVLATLSLSPDAKQSKLPLEYPTGPFFIQGNSLIAQERQTDRERQRERERASKGSNGREQERTNKTQSKRCDAMARRLRSEWVVEHKKNREFLAAGLLSNSINQSFVFSFTSFSHFLFDATDASAACKRTNERQTKTGSGTRTTLGNLVFLRIRIN